MSGAGVPLDFGEAVLLDLLTKPERERVLVEGGSVFSATFRDWEAMRRPVTAAIHQPGTLLDIGCANGLLLRCLLAWSPHALIPYGIDIDQQRLAAARELLPPFAQNFAQIALHQLDAAALAQDGLPPTYDFVFWNVWDELDFLADWHWNYFERALGVLGAGGRLILGFYDHDPSRIQAQLGQLIRRLGPPVGQIGPVHSGVVFAWWSRLSPAVSSVPKS